jgi:hypothetical protein
MSRISLDLRGVDYVSDQGSTLRAWRAFVEVRFIVPGGGQIPFECFVDPGAPFSVVPYSLWHVRRLTWTCLGRQLTRPGKRQHGALTWQGVACELGSTSVYLLDLATGIRNGPYSLTAKFVRQRLPSLESAAILGMNFLADNDLRLLLDGTGGAMTGYLVVPGP